MGKGRLNFTFLLYFDSGQKHVVMGHNVPQFIHSTLQKSKALKIFLIVYISTSVECNALQ